MNTKEMAKKYSVNEAELESFVLRSNFKFKSTMLNGIIVMDDPQTVIDQFKEYLENTRIKEERLRLEDEKKKEEEKKREEERILASVPFYINEEKRTLIEKIRNEAIAREEKELVYRIIGTRGRILKIYPYKCVISTNVTIGSILTGNSTDGEKTIYFKDCIGVQYKKPGATLGYLQFETATAIMNNDKSNFFNENTFTFEGMWEQMDEVYRFVIGLMDEIKRAQK